MNNSIKRIGISPQIKGRYSFFSQAFFLLFFLVVLCRNMFVATTRYLFFNQGDYAGWGIDQYNQDYYENDSCERLYLVKNDNGDFLTRYNYNFKQ